MEYITYNNVHIKINNMIHLQIILYVLIAEIVFYILLLNVSSFLKKSIVNTVDRFINLPYVYFSFVFIIVITTLVALESLHYIYKNQNQYQHQHQTHNIFDNSHAKLYRAQRNAYLSIMTLFCSYANYRMIRMFRKKID